MLCSCSSTYSGIVRVGIGQEFNEEFGRPLILLIEYDPWASVIGSDVPIFVLYENGQIIYRVIEDNELNLYYIQFERDDIEDIIKSFEIPNSIYYVPNSINAVSSFVTDQPYTVLILDYKHRKTIDVYGSLPGNQHKSSMNKFMLVYNKLINYHNENAEKWLPERIEVLFWDYSYAPNKRPWIEGFPDLNSPETIKRSKYNESYSVFIRKEQFKDFIEYYYSTGEREAVEINQKLMSMSFRFPFPNIR